MIVFSCPSCQTKMQAADEHAGLIVECPTCKRHASVPKGDAEAAAVTATPPAPTAAETSVTTPDVAHGTKSERRRRDDYDDDDSPRRQRGSSGADAAGAAAATGLGVGMIVLIAFGVGAFCVLVPSAILIALLVPAVQKTREAAARTQSINNLKNISLGIHGFHDAHRRLPFNGTKDAIGNDNTSGSWAFQILPFMDHGPMFNQAQRNQGVSFYMCPGRGRPNMETGKGAWSDYFYNNYLNDPEKASNPAAPDKKRVLVKIEDGSSNTIMVGHGNIRTSQYSQQANVTLCSNILVGGTTGTMRAGNDGVANPQGVFLKRDSDDAPQIGSWGGPFPQGGLMAMGDATVRIFHYNTNNLNAFLTPSGGEVVNIPDF